MKSFSKDQREAHLVLHCPYIQEVWRLVSGWKQFNIAQQILQSNFDTKAERWEAAVKSRRPYINTKMHF
jgi:hypothetical protein